MKRIVCFFLAVLMLFSLAGCVQTQLSQEPNTSTEKISEVKIAPEPTTSSDAAPSPQAAPSSETTKASDSTHTPEPIPTTTVHVFDVNSVSMQETPDSSCFSEVGYDTVWEVLVVQFRDSGSVYTYSNFPDSEWKAFITSDSLGRWYNKHIKGRYEYERIN